jgi:hypothetical protein
LAPRAAGPAGHAVARRRGAALLAALCLGLGLVAPARAGSFVASATLRHCEAPRPASAGQQDRLLRLGALLRDELHASGRPVALVARSGLNLGRFGIRYSHAGLALRDSPNTPWSVRQLYYACDEGRPRLFDQGLAGFLGGMDDPDQGYLVVLLLPAEAGEALARAALDSRQALQLLGGDYSANAHAFSTRYQNCNQWVAELMAAAWGGADGRAQAQQWLRAQGYAPSRVELLNPLWRLAAAFVPWLHEDDHPPTPEGAVPAYALSLPASLEAFARQRWPAAQRLEICHRGGQALLRRDGPPLAEGCRPEAGDTVLALD